MANWIHAGSLDSFENNQAKVIKGLAVFFHEESFYAVDNRCPHMGFPLHMGSLCEGILTCHWHHARFDVCSGGTFDPWADDVASYETKVEHGEVWVNHAPSKANQIPEYKNRLVKGLEQNLSLVIAKAVVGLVKDDVPTNEIITIGLTYGTTHRRSGWGPGLTILTAMANILERLDQQGQIQALYQGLTFVARDCAGNPPKHVIGPLSGFDGDMERLKNWYRNCIEVRDTEGAERILLTAIMGGMKRAELSGMMLTAASDHFYMDTGHTYDFHNKAFEALKYVDEENKNTILASLTPLLSNATRSEELHSWQAPINLVEPLDEAFEKIHSCPLEKNSFHEQTLLDKILSDKPLEMIEYITSLLQEGANPVKVAQIVSLAAAERIVRFHTQNDFSDWITVLHTFTHAHAVHESVRRTEEPLLIRAIYHGAVSVYLDRFLNIPATKRPVADPSIENFDSQSFLRLLDKQQQVNQAGKWVMNYLHHNGDKYSLFNTLGHALLREDANFHSYQMYEAACAEYDYWDAESSEFADRAQETLLIATARYLAAHAPTAREMPHTGKIAWRLHLGEKLFETE